ETPAPTPAPGASWPAPDRATSVEERAGRRRDARTGTGTERHAALTRPGIGHLRAVGTAVHRIGRGRAAVEACPPVRHRLRQAGADDLDAVMDAASRREMTARLQAPADASRAVGSRHVERAATLGERLPSRLTPRGRPRVLAAGTERRGGGGH